MALSQRANAFFKRHEKNELELTEQEIRKFFKLSNAPVFDPLIEFQQRFGGLEIYDRLVPVRYTLLKGLGGYPRENLTCEIEFDTTDSKDPGYIFDCACYDDLPVGYLDENGFYYENSDPFTPSASSFEKYLEQLALVDEINSRKDFQLEFQYLKLNTEKIDNYLNLDIIWDASDQYTLWFKNEWIYMKQWQGYTTLVASDKCPDKNKITDLIEHYKATQKL